jgi:hypothetical protein
MARTLYAELLYNGSQVTRAVNRLPRNDSYSNYGHLVRLVSSWYAPPGLRIYYDTAITSTVIHGEKALSSVFLIGMVRYTPARKIEGDVEHAIF